MLEFDLKEDPEEDLEEDPDEDQDMAEAREATAEDQHH